MVMITYHVTPSSNLESIMREGLVPKIGDRSYKVDEQHPAVYLFPNMEEVENALMRRYGIYVRKNLYLKKYTFFEDKLKRGVIPRFFFLEDIVYTFNLVTETYIVGSN